MTFILTYKGKQLLFSLFVKFSNLSAGFVLVLQVNPLNRINDGTSPGRNMLI